MKLTVAGSPDWRESRLASETGAAVTAARRAEARKRRRAIVLGCVLICGGDGDVDVEEADGLSGCLGKSF